LRSFGYHASYSQQSTFAGGKAVIPDIAVGAIVAAIIGAMISLAGLIVAKESKVSEFRQAWIDSLRKELSQFVTNINALTDANRVAFKDDMERFEKLSEPTSRLNEAYYSVALRLNVSEASASAVRNSMVKLAGMATSPTTFDQTAFNSERVEFINASNTLLKDEWKRVKAGEKVYRTTRIFAASLIGLLILAVIIILAAGLTKKKVDQKTTEISQGSKAPQPTPSVAKLNSSPNAISAGASSVTRASIPRQTETPKPARSQPANSGSKRASTAL
jgi:predicted PurR-regulated permease PerM